MRLHNKIFTLCLTVLMLFTFAAQASGTEYLFSDPVLYVDDAPTFILENLDLTAGLRNDGSKGLVWLDILADDNLALKSAVGLDESGVFAALGGIPAAYGVSGSTIALLTGLTDSSEVYAMLSPEKISADLTAFLDALFAGMEDGTTQTVKAALSGGETDITVKNIAGTIDTSAVTSTAFKYPLLSGILSAIQVTGNPVPDIGTWNVTGLYGTAGEGENTSSLYRINAVSGDKACEANLLIDKSASPAGFSFKLTGTDTDINVTAEFIPGQYILSESSGSIGGKKFETELKCDNTGAFLFGGGVYSTTVHDIFTATVILEEGDFYFAVSRDVDGIENTVYLTSDTLPETETARSGIATLGVYDAGSRIELVSDLTITNSEETGLGRSVDAAYPTEIITLTPETRNKLGEDIVNVINGAMYVISLHVPGFTYEPLASFQDLSGLISGDTE